MPRRIRSPGDHYRIVDARELIRGDIDRESINLQPGVILPIESAEHAINFPKPLIPKIVCQQQARYIARLGRKIFQTSL